MIVSNDGEGRVVGGNCEPVVVVVVVVVVMRGRIANMRS